MTIFEDFTDLKTAIGRDFGYTDFVTVTQEMINNFAKATLDHQWIHTDIERAKETPYGGTIAHGFLTLSLLTKFLEDLMYVKTMTIGMNYGLNKVRFMRPVPSGSNVRMKATLFDVEDYRGNGVKATLNTVLEVENSLKPVCVAEWMILLFA
jgi:NADPH:quinone reductase